MLLRNPPKQSASSGFKVPDVERPEVMKANNNFSTLVLKVPWLAVWRLGCLGSGHPGEHRIWDLRLGVDVLGVGSRL